MKLVQDLPEIFEEFGEKRREAFLEVKEYKDKGVPVVEMCIRDRSEGNRCNKMLQEILWEHINIGLEMR